MLCAFANIYRVTNITKYRDFQYRLLNKAIFFNDQLYHWKKVPTQQCDFCPADKQNLVHFFLECRVVRNFFMELKEFFSIDMNCNVKNFDLKAIVLNDIHDNPSHVVNFLFLLAKNYLFCCKCTGKKISLCIFYLRSVLFKVVSATMQWKVISCLYMRKNGLPLTIPPRHRQLQSCYH